MKSSRSKKILSALLSSVYFCVNVALLHATEVNIWSERKKSHPHFEVASLPELTRPISIFNPTALPVKSSEIKRSPKITQLLPPAYGTVRHITGPRNSSKGTLIHIQDVHLNAEAQLNIQRTVEELINNKAIDFVALEGASGPIDLTVFRKFPNTQAVKLASDYLMKQNEISGPVYAALTSPAEIPTFSGIDDAEHYQENIQAYRASHLQKSAAQKQLLALQNQLIQDKKHLFGPALAAFDSLAIAYQKVPNLLP
jgi:hypothetical protein